MTITNIRVPTGLGTARQDRLATHLALAGASLGLVAGVIEVAVGSSIRSWIGDKSDPVRLGLATVVAALIALAAAVTASRRGVHGRRLAVVLRVAVPALVCFTTAGRLWWVPGALLLVAAAVLLAGVSRHESACAASTGQWDFALVQVCGAYYVWLGGTALGVAGIAGIAGGGAAWLSLVVLDRHRVAAALLLVVALVPFAVLTWWSLVTPLIAMLGLALGLPIILRRSHGRPPAPRSRT